MFDQGSTAVLSSPETPFLVAVKKAGIYSFQNGEWLLQYALAHSLYKLVHIAPYVFGIGDNGAIVRYNPFQKKWTHTFFPTSQRLWDITGDGSGVIITHAGSKLYLSEDFGSSWTILHPFKELSNPPLIRSLFYKQGNIYIGTQIHSTLGGLWKYNRSKQLLTRIKAETTAMISSIHLEETGQELIIAKGNSRNRVGSIESKQLCHSQWHVYQAPLTENAFLDVFAVGDQLYTTTSTDEYGYSRIYQLNKRDYSLIPIETVAGHGLRGAGLNNELFISSPIESKWIDRNREKTRILH